MSVFPRFLSTTLKKAFESPRGRLIVLTGARQTGKSTLLKGLLPDFPYFNLDDPLLRQGFSQMTGQRIAEQYPRAIWDEIQKAPELIEKLKAAHDANESTQYALSGSSQILLMRSIRESLAGRAALYQMNPLTLPELRSPNQGLLGEVEPSPLKKFIAMWRKGESTKESFRNIPPILSANSAYHRSQMLFEEYLQQGGMPFLKKQGMTADDKQAWLKDYVRTYLQRDLMDIASLHDLDSFVKAEKVLAARSGTLLNYADAARDAGIAPDSLRRYARYLEISFQAFSLPSWSRNVGKRLVKMPKFCFVDPGIIRALTQQFGEPDGRFFESAVIAEISKQLSSETENGSLFHLRTSDGREVDLLIEYPEGFIALEIKASAKAAPTHARHFRGLKEILDKPLLAKILLTQDPHVQFFEETETLAMPVAAALGGY